MSEAIRHIRRLTGSQRNAGLFRQLVIDSAGNVLPLMAVGTLVLAGIVGGGVDMARAYKAERRLQAACDAGVLAGRRAVATNGFDTSAQAQANRYFDANFDEAAQQTTGTVFTPTSPDNGNTINATATAALGTVIMRIFGFNSFSLGVSCSASMGVGNSDIVMVLDNTGSMSSWADGKTRIQALKDSMKAFRDTVAASTAGTNARVRYGFVPYGSAVNVGSILMEEDPSYLADELTVQSVAFVNWNSTPVETWVDDDIDYTTTTAGDWENVGSRYSDTDDCEDALPANTAWANNGSPYMDTTSIEYDIDPNTGYQIKTIGWVQPQQRTEYRCRNRYRQTRTANRKATTDHKEARTPIPVTTHDTGFADAILQRRTFDVRAYKSYNSTTKTFNATVNPAWVNSSGSRTNFMANSTWEGCIYERKTVPQAAFSFVSLDDGIDPEEALDLNIDRPPTPGEPDTQWVPAWPEITFLRGDSRSFSNIAYQAVDHDGTGIDEDDLEDQIAETYCPFRSQLLAPMSESDFDFYADQMEATSYGTFHDFGLLWGARISSPFGIFADNVNEEPGNGGTVSRHLIFMTDGQMENFDGVNTLYGVEYLDKRITGGSSSPSEESRHSARTWALCEAIKARGVRLWVIAFGTTLTDRLELDADEPGDVGCSSPNSAFQANNAADLNRYFQEIANQVGELRVTQ